MQDFRKLRVWHLAQEVTVEVYRCSSAFPREEIYGMTAQIRRASISIGANVAEGSKRDSRPDKARFLNISQGSAAEAISLVDVAMRLGYLPQELGASLTDRFDHIAAMLELLRQSVKEG